MTTETKNITKGHCPRCNSMTNSHIRARHIVNWQDKDDNVNGAIEYLTLECAGCNTVYFQEDSYDDFHLIRGDFNSELGEDEWIYEHHLTHYPAETKRQKPDFMSEVELHDEILERLIRELYIALNADLRVLTAIGMRTIFERTYDLLKVPPARTFEQKIEALTVAGKIGSDEKAILEVLVDAGNAAAHRGWSPTTREVYTMMDVVEAFLKRAFVLDASMKKLKTRVPPKPPKPPKLSKKL